MHTHTIDLDLEFPPNLCRYQWLLQDVNEMAMEVYLKFVLHPPSAAKAMAVFVSGRSGSLVGLRLAGATD